MWSVANETPRGQARDHFLTGLVQRARELDNDRLVSMAMETETHDNISTVEDNLSDLVDILSFNNYLGWYGGKPSDCERRKWFFDQDKPVVVSEFGAGAVAGRFGDKDEKWTEEYQAEVYRQTLKMGIVSDKGRTKQAFYVLQDFYKKKGAFKHVKKQ